MERSTDQVIKPVNVGALSKWVGKIPPDVLQDMAVIAPMLAKLGYICHVMRKGNDRIVSAGNGINARETLLIRELKRSSCIKMRQI